MEIIDLRIPDVEIRYVLEIDYNLNMVIERHRLTVLANISCHRSIFDKINLEGPNEVRINNRIIQFSEVSINKGNSEVGLYQIDFFKTNEVPW